MQREGGRSSIVLNIYLLIASVGRLEGVRIIDRVDGIERIENWEGVIIIYKRNWVHLEGVRIICIRDREEWGIISKYKIGRPERSKNSL